MIMFQCDWNMNIENVINVTEIWIFWILEMWLK